LSSSYFVTESHTTPAVARDLAIVRRSGRRCVRFLRHIVASRQRRLCLNGSGSERRESAGHSGLTSLRP
jgi:hypothetical protein